MEKRHMLNERGLVGVCWSLLAAACIGWGGGDSMAAEPRVEIVGHRGASYDAPENTLSAIRLAWEQQADAVEFDVWLSKDGQIVLAHDKDTKRTAGVDRRIDEQTFAELQKLDVGRWKAEKYAGERIPKLSDVLPLTPEGKRLFIEIKCGPEIVPELTTVLKQAARPASETAIISFSDEVCAACKRAFPELKVYWIVSLKQNSAGKWNHSADSLISRAKELGVDGLDLSAKPLINAAFGRQVRDAGLELLVWTVNDLDVARSMIAAGVQGITTDRPGWLREQLAITE